jgi:DNA-binding transcriptional LysR family regulator
VSKAIIELEEELGVDIFTRHGKRIRGLTEPGRLVLESVELIMQEIDSLKRIGKEYAAQDSGSFTIATTHTQARYTLPRVVQAFMLKFPKVRLSLLQGNGPARPGRPGHRHRIDRRHQRFDHLAMLSMGTRGGGGAGPSAAEIAAGHAGRNCRFPHHHVR